MIDKITIYKHISVDITVFDSKWNEIRNNINEIVGYRIYIKHIEIQYYSKSKTLIINGRLNNILSSSTIDRIKNFDDTWTGDIESKQDLDTVIDRVNQLLFELLKINTNILEFNLSYIEICCNISLQSQRAVEQYIILFNNSISLQEKKRMVNFVDEKNKSKQSSCYIKTYASYRDKNKYNYQLNYYNKYEQLNNLKKQYTIPESEIEKAKNILRMELQIGCRKLKAEREKYHINKQLKDFDFFQCKQLIIDYYSRFICKNYNPYVKYVSYETAKKIIDANAPDPRLMEYIKYIAKYNKLNQKSDTTNRKYIKKLFATGLHFCFMPKQWNIDMLTSPITLLDEKIKENQKLRYTYQNQLIDTDNKLQYINLGKGQNDDISKLFNK